MCKSFFWHFSIGRVCLPWPLKLQLENSASDPVHPSLRAEGGGALERWVERKMGNNKEMVTLGKPGGETGAQKIFRIIDSSRLHNSGDVCAWGIWQGNHVIIENSLHLLMNVSTIPSCMFKSPLWSWHKPFPFWASISSSVKCKILKCFHCHF